MIIWLTIQMFEAIYGTTITGAELATLQAISFLELLVELFLIFIVIGVAVINIRRRHD